MSHRTTRDLIATIIVTLATVHVVSSHSYRNATDTTAVARAPGNCCHRRSRSTGMRLYESRGFRTVGIYHEQGQLDGRWVDTNIMECMLDE
jgi:hypothetical protein